LLNYSAIHLPMTWHARAAKRDELKVAPRNPSSPDPVVTSRRAIPCKPRQLAGEYWHAPFPFWRLKSRYIPGLSYLEIGGTESAREERSQAACLYLSQPWSVTCWLNGSGPRQRLLCLVAPLLLSSVVYPMRVPTKRSKPHPALSRKGVGSDF